MTEVLYKKVGRKYVPVRQTFDGYDSPTIPVGTFVLTYAYTDGGRSYTYDVTPDTASFVAAAKVAQKAMEEAIQEKKSAIIIQDKTKYLLLDQYLVGPVQIILC